MLTALGKGRRVRGAVVNLAAAGAANAQVIFQLSNWAAQLGTKSFFLKRVWMMNNAAGQQTVMIGTGVAGAFAAVIPGLVSINNMDVGWPEDDLNEIEVFADLTAYPVALIAAGTIDIQVEVEEIG